MKNKVKVSIDGKSFTLVGEEPEEHIRQVAAYIDGKMAEIREQSTAVSIDTGLAYVLTSINVADDYFKEKNYAAELEGRLIGLTARVQELVSKLDAAEKKLEESEKEKEDAENRLDEYTMALESGNTGHPSSVRHKKPKK